MSESVRTTRADLLGDYSLSDFEKMQRLGLAPPGQPYDRPVELELWRRIRERRARYAAGGPVDASRQGLVTLVVAAVAETGIGDQGVRAEWLRRALLTFAASERTGNKRARGARWASLARSMHEHVRDVVTMTPGAPALHTRSFAASLRSLAEAWQPLSPGELVALRHAAPVTALDELLDAPSVKPGAALMNVMPALGVALAVRAEAVLRDPQLWAEAVAVGTHGWQLRDAESAISGDQLAECLRDPEFGPGMVRLGMVALGWLHPEGGELVCAAVGPAVPHVVAVAAGR